MRKRFVLAAWLIGILFPMAWLGRYSDRYKFLFNKLFSPEWMHWVMHAMLFAGLTILVMVSFDLNTTVPRTAKKTLCLVLLISMGVGIIQEGLQLLTGAPILQWNTLLDLGVDMAGTLCGYLVLLGVRKIRRTHSPPVTKSRA